MDIVIDHNLVHFEIVNPKAKKDCLVLHGWGQNGHLWANAVSHLPPDFRYYLLDLPGFGRSPLLPISSGIPQYSDFVLAFIKKNNIKHPIILGHSFGGQIATHIAATHPSVISFLILISPAIDRRKSLKQKLKIFVYRQFSFLKAILPEPLLCFLLSRISSTDYYNSSPEHRDILKKIVNFDLMSQLNQAKIPSFLVWGENDTEIPYSGRIIANLFPDCRLYILQSDHNPHLNLQSQLIPTLKHIFSLTL
ncbi:MAG: alpha/beta fold hydrolase [Candidatus Shapirobacteria bacterium]|jgi:pimeloyl-ACP methyl ester carboxylesterase